MSLRFANPWLLLLLVLPPLALSLPYLARRWRAAALRFPDTRPLDDLPVSRRLTLRPLPALLRLAGMMLVVLALARPQSGQASEVVKGEGVDIALALDLSGSMASLDFEPLNRLEAAKEMTAAFIEARSYDRIGLVVFAEDAYLQSPLTSDHNTLLRQLDALALAPDLGIEDGTALGQGLVTAASLLEDSEDESRVVILLTDGVNNAGTVNPLTAAQAAAALGMRVYPIGMGRPGPVPALQRDASGNEQIILQESELDEGTLQTIADLTGGRYARAEDLAALERIYSEIDALEPSHYQVTRYTRTRERMAWFLLPGIILLLLDFVLSRTVFRTLP
jgi:Ca-activated chloride channel family protein